MKMMVEFQAVLCFIMSVTSATAAISLPDSSFVAPVSVKELTRPANDEVQLVRLRRRNARTIDKAVIGKSFYTARVWVGKPRQAMHVAFDTSSGQVILPTATCTTLACLEHRRYRHEESELASSINADGKAIGNSTTRDAISIGFTSLDLGDGRVTGQLFLDALCLLSDHELDQPQGFCKGVGVVAATQLSDTPFRAAPFDGIIGLGMRGLALSSTFSFIEMIEAKGEEAPRLQQFALYHGDTYGEAAFGGHNPKRLASPLGWVPVTNAKDGYWQVSINAIRMGDRTLKVCSEGNCRGILDSGTSTLGVPIKAMPEFESALASTQQLRHLEGGGCGGEDLHLELSGGQVVTLRAEDYFSGENCDPSISSLDLPESFAGVFIFGEPILRRYYTVYDWKEGAERIGFGLAAKSGGLEEASVRTAEALEDFEEARESSMDGISTNYGVIFMLLQAFFCRAIIVIALVVVGTHMSTGRRLFTWIEGILVYKSLLLNLARFATALPQNEVPAGDECVICLGSCDDDPAALAGVPGLQKAASLADESGHSHCSSAACLAKKDGPRWRRLRCGHHFHETCIFEWLRKSKQCPTCRRHFITDSSKEDEASQSLASRIFNLNFR